MADKNQPQQGGEKSQVPQPAEPLVQGAEQIPQAGGAAAAALQRVKAAPPAEADPADVLTLQRAMGNRAVRSILAREGQGAAVGETIGMLQRGVLGQVMREDGEDGGGTTTEAAVDPEQQALQDFVDRGVMPNERGQDVIGAAGLGGFNAKYDPDLQKLVVTVDIGINFHHALWIEPMSGLVFPDLSGMGAGDADEMGTLIDVANRINSRVAKREDREKLVNEKFRWEDGEKGTWMRDYRNAVLDIWDNRHYFKSKRWEELEASVEIVLNTEEIGAFSVISEAIRAAAGAGSGYHCTARIIKTPPTVDLGAYVTSGEGGSARDQGLFMSSSGIGPNATNFLRYRLQFENGKSTLDKAVGVLHGTDPGPDYLDKFIEDFKAGRPTEGVPIKVIGRASATGDPARNQTLSEQRARAVASYLQANGLTGSIDRVTEVGAGTEGATEDAEWRRVDIIVGSGEAQNTAAHEFGHMIGLGDEYAAPAGGFYPATPGTGSDIPIGDPADHDALASAMGGGVQGAVGENTDSIMSVGNTVRPQHYATFHKALLEVTGESWEYGGTGTGRGRVLPAVGGPGAGTATA